MLSSMRCQSSSDRLQPILLATTLACSFAVFASAAVDVVSAAEKELPRADELLDRYINATGGKEAYDKIKNRVSKGTMEFAGQGIKLSGTLYAAKPNLVCTILASDATGKIESGTDGRVVWENSLLKGPAIKKGAERSNALRDSTFDRLVYWKTVYGKAECVGRQAVDGNMCFKIVLTPKRPKASTADQKESELLTLYINETSSLVTKIESKVVTAAGTIPVEAYFSDYKIVDGILISHKVVIRLLNQERIMTISDIKHNVELPQDRFEFPDQIQALLDKEQRAVRKL
jgi:hypothetical protein